jgi:hypothetical protein
MPFQPSPPRQVPPPPPGNGASSWYRSNWKWVVAGVAGVLVGAVAGASGNGTKVRTVVSNETSTQTDTQTVTVRKPARVRTKTVTVTPAAPPTPSPSASGGGGGNSYSGNGQKNVGTVTVPVDSVLKWHAAGGLFAITNDFNDADTIDVSSNASSGETAVAAGTYHKVDVLAAGDWGFTISPK